jgi:hypothetical protein
MLRSFHHAMIATAALLAASCSSSGSTPNFVAPADDGGLQDGAQDQAAADVPWSDTPALDVVTPTDTGEPTGKTVVYAHNDTRLYKVDPEDATLKPTDLGAFDCVSGDNTDPAMTDIAVDKDGNLYGVSASTVYLNMKVSGAAVECKAGKVTIDPGTVNDASFYGLTFAPATAKLGTTETLIGSTSNGDLYMIDKTNGKLTLVGNFGKVPSVDGQGHDYDTGNVGKNWELSGDIVFLENSGSPVGFATLRDCPTPPDSKNCSKVDTLVEIDISKLAPTAQGGTPPIVTKAVRGMVLPAGCSDASCGFGSMYGIAAFKKNVYGFSRQGKIITIDNDTGVGSNAVDALPTTAGFAGAGVTTLAPVIPPPPK